MSIAPHQLELLSPAKTAEIGREAILHGADAVYIGGPAFGARSNAGNDIADIAGLCDFAHRFGARIFVALNTILHDAELEPARQQIHQLYEAGVDALIVQDMGLLELDLPPIDLHASTQCDIRTVEKAKFLGDVGFSQIVLARELALPQIREIHAATDATLEFFIHRALCVAFSGQCYISHAHTERSANRGDCSQDCRMPYTLTDQSGGVVAFEKHLLSMKDNNQSANLGALIEAGIRSFKIEGRYKDVAYVKNITGHYRRLLDAYMTAHPEFAPASSGRTTLLFTPNPDKTFNRSATDYFVNGRKEDIGAFDSPKFVGLPIGTVTKVGQDWFEMEASEPLANGDGLNYQHKREVFGVPVNVATRQGAVWRIEPNVRIADLPGFKPGIAINRNGDHAWEMALQRKSAERRIGVRMGLAETADGFSLTLTDTDGINASVVAAVEKTPAQQADKALETLRTQLGKLGNTDFVADEIALELSQPWFIPASLLNALRRDAVAALETARVAHWQSHRPQRKPAVEPPVPYPDKSLSYLANVYNQKARDFYTRHGVELIAAAFEAHEEAGEVSLMITKHCLRFSYNLCPKQAKGVTGVQGQVRAEPMTLVSGNERYTLKFDCRPCEMHVMGKAKKHILNSPPPSVVPVTFFKQRPAG
ncbi:MAG TPA: U32 family peptidase [Rhodocyclaceae bacterium]|nr:U32 family peptidase [Rhodocyclaceae bacterium]